MVTLKQIKKIEDYLKNQKDVVTQTAICSGVNIANYLVREALEFLNSQNKINMMTNGLTILVKWRDENE